MISIGRRVLRVVSLHLLDGALVLGTVFLLVGLWPTFAGVLPFTAVIVAVYLLSLNALSAYRPGDARRDRGRLLSGSVLAGLILSCLAVFQPRLPFDPLFLASFVCVAFLALSVGRWLVDLSVRQVYRHGIGLRRAVLVGNLDEVGRAIYRLRDRRNVDQYVVGHLAANEEADPTALGRLGDLTAVLYDRDVQEVILATTLPGDVLDAVASECFERGVALYAFSVSPDITYCRGEVARLGPCLLQQLHPARLQPPAMMLKRAVDIGVSLLALVLLAPLFLIVALAIKLDSPGSVFYRQQRVGLGARAFTMWKFRSMCADAEEREEELAHLNVYRGRGTFKVRNDPRTTRVGRLLRRTSLDELPQLVNVLLGDMSLVGPRPALMPDLARYEPHHYERLSVVPGITGPWQVGGRSLVTDFDHVVGMEQDYIRSWSLLLDVKILLRTVKVVVRGEGAY